MSELPITLEMIPAAERLMGVSYTRAERVLMLDNLAGQIVVAQARRKLVFPNDLGS